MPLFEYVCEECEREFELLVSHRETPACPKCGSIRMNRLMSAAAGRVASGSGLPIASSCPPPSMGPCGTGCCRLPQ